MIPRLALLASACLPVVAADWISADFGAQPVAIGAGARALGMGGAFSAVADDATAVTWNPSGLTRCERPELALSASAHHQRVRSDSGQDDDAASVDLDHVSAMLPFFALGCQQVVGVAWQRQYDFGRSLRLSFTTVNDDPFFGNTTVQTERIERSGSYASLGLCYAIEPIPGWSLGVSIHDWRDAWTRASATSASRHNLQLTDYVDPSWSDETYQVDALTRTRVLDGRSIEIGTFWQATAALTVALVVKPGYELGLEHNVRTTIFEDYGPGFVSTQTSTVAARSTLRHPSRATLGLAWRQDDTDTVAVDVTMTRWREYHLDGATGRRSPVHYLIPPEDFDDLVTLRLGYEHVAILPRMVLVPRLGALFEELPAATPAPSLTRVEESRATRDHWWGLTAGCSLCQRRVIYDVGAQVRWGDDVGAGQYAAPDATADVVVVTARAGVTIQF
jgi:hypothetical protein